MPNSNPNLDNLKKGRGKKPKLGHKPFTVNLLPSEKDILDEIAKSFNCKHGKKGSLSRLLSKIATNELSVVETPKYFLEPIQQKNTEHIISNPQEDIDQDLLNNQSQKKKTKSSVSDPQEVYR